MPPKTKFTRAQILKAAFDIVRELGMENLSTRAVAKRLKCSTMPVYTCLKSRNNLEDTIAAKALEILLEYETNPLTEDSFLNMGIGYVRFARDEKHLFRCICGEEQTELFKNFMKSNLEALVTELSDYPLMNGKSRDDILQFVHQGWVYAHGLAHLVNSGFYPRLTDDEIKGLMEYTGRRYISGFQAMEERRD